MRTSSAHAWHPTIAASFVAFHKVAVLVVAVTPFSVRFHPAAFNLFLGGASIGGKQTKEKCHVQHPQQVPTQPWVGQGVGALRNNGSAHRLFRLML